MLQKTKVRLAKIAKETGCIVKFNQKLEDGFEAAYFIENKTIVIGRDCNNSRELASTFFHELGHHYCSQFNIYEDYHKRFNENTYKLALRAELYVDAVGEEMYCDAGFKDLGKYIRSYRTQESKAWLKEYWLDAEIERLKQRYCLK